MARKKKQPYRWIQNNMLLQRDITPWSPGYLIGEGKADALFRTGYGAIAYAGTKKGDKFLEGIKSCFKDDGNGGIKAWRYPVDEDNDTFSGLENSLPFDSVSRDQIILAFLGLAVNGREDLVKRYHEGLKWRLSPMFTQTVDFWLFAKALSGKWFWVQVFWLLSLLLMSINVIWNKFIFWIGGLARKGKDPINGYGEVPIDYDYDWKWTKLDDMIYKAQFPHFAFVQFCMQMYVMPKHPIKKVLQWVCGFNHFKHNLLVRLLLEDKVSKEEIDNYTPRYGNRWQSRMNITSRSDAKPLKPEHMTDLNYDKDILYSLSKLNSSK